MKKSNIYVLGTILFFAVAIFSLSQEGTVDRTSVSFSNPSKPGKLEASVHNGSITVKGYDGKEVIVEAKTRGKMIKGPEEMEEFEVEMAKVVKKREKPKKTEGMRLISSPGGAGLEIEEEDNVMEISVSSFKQSVDLIIQVPSSTSLELSAHTNGDITVENVNGEIEVNHHNGALKLSGISGNVVAHTFNGGITVTFAKANPEKPMSFSTWNGDIDVTFPANIKANVKMKSERGEVYSDFDIRLEKAPQRIVEDSRKEGGTYKISFEKYILGTINGGGPEYQFNTYNGDILIRKAK
jgi:DUF4097 and DUF4098 domain-containing protein YvlB